MPKFLDKAATKRVFQEIARKVDPKWWLQLADDNIRWDLRTKIPELAWLQDACIEEQFFFSNRTNLFDRYLKKHPNSIIPSRDIKPGSYLQADRRRAYHTAAAIPLTQEGCGLIKVTFDDGTSKEHFNVPIRVSRLYRSEHLGHDSTTVVLPLGVWKQLLDTSLSMTITRPVDKFVSSTFDITPVFNGYTDQSCFREKSFYLCHYNGVASRCHRGFRDFRYGPITNDAGDSVPGWRRTEFNVQVDALRSTVNTTAEELLAERDRAIEAIREIIKKRLGA